MRALCELRGFARNRAVFYGLGQTLSIIDMFTKLPIPKHKLQHALDLVHAARLLKIPLHTQLMSLTNRCRTRVGGNENKRNSLDPQIVVLLNTLFELDTIHRRHIHVGQNNKWLLLRRLQVIESIVGSIEKAHLVQNA